jgi:hypothetical protein
VVIGITVPCLPDTGETDSPTRAVRWHLPYRLFSVRETAATAMCEKTRG